MPAPVKKVCLKQGCISRDIVVTTDKEKCLMCNGDLTKWNPLGDLLGGNPLGGPFGGLFG